MGMGQGRRRALEVGAPVLCGGTVTHRLLEGMVFPCVLSLPTRTVMVVREKREEEREWGGREGKRELN